jgi:L,D-transpeptidase catalytic domain
MRACGCALVVAAALSGCVASAAADGPSAPAAPDPTAQPTAIETLSVPGTLSRWAFVVHAVVARRAPDSAARAVARMHLKTHDGTDELVMALARTRDAAGRPWVKIRLPILPNGTTGWVPADALGGFHRVTTWLRVDLRRLRATLVRSGRVVFRARIGAGRRKWPTPTGEFYVRDRLEGFPSGGLYGPLAFGLNARSAVLTDWPGGGFIGIHGTNQPWLLPGRVSHGCIRMRNRDILRLGHLMPVGTPVSITD